MNNYNEDQQKKDEAFKIVQKFLKDPPVIIWGSGATIPYGLPSVDDLRKTLKSQKVISLEENSNLEMELGKLRDTEKINQVRTLIRSEVLKRDIECLKQSIQNNNYFNAINKMIEVFFKAHPQKMDIITSNYDRVLEYAISRLGYDYTDGFTGKQLSKFDKDNFKTKNIINLMKVHGSLNWFSFNNGYPFFLTGEYEDKINDLKPLMVLPSNDKYQDSFQEPYRTIIQKADEVIDEATSFLVVGFGFNDEHITPKLENKIKNGTPIVIITKEATDSYQEKLQNAKKYCLFEEGENETTKLESSEEQLDWYKIRNLDGTYWKLENFMEIL